MELDDLVLIAVVADRSRGNDVERATEKDIVCGFANDMDLQLECDRTYSKRDVSRQP